MISSLSGILLDSTTSPLTIQVAGVGYEVFVTSDTLLACSGFEKDGLKPVSTTLWIHHVTREDSEELFGFKQKTERDFFRKLISVSGIGPRGGLAILESSPLGILVDTIKNKKTDLLFKLPGIGKKTAEKIVLELSDKLDDFGSVNETSNFDNDAFDALVQLGYRERDIIATLQLVSKEENMEIEQVIKTAIRMMSKN